MKLALQAIHELEREGLIRSAAIGGAMALLFHDEPVVTYDLGIFCLLPQTGLLVSLAPIYAALLARGFTAEAEAVVIGGVPVQFIPAYNALVTEALEHAEPRIFDGVPARVLTLGHLIAIMCRRTGPKTASGWRCWRTTPRLMSPGCATYCPGTACLPHGTPWTQPPRPRRRRSVRAHRGGTGGEGLRGQSPPPKLAGLPPGRGEISPAAATPTDGVGNPPRCRQAVPRAMAGGPARVSLAPAPDEAEDHVRRPLQRFPSDGEG